MLDGIYKVSSYNLEIENILNTKIENNILSNNEFQEFIEKYAEKINSCDPKDLEDIYRKTGIKILHIFKDKEKELIIDPYNIEYKSKEIKYSRNTRLISMIITEIENQVDERYKIKLKLDDTDIEDKDTRYEYLEKINKIDEYIERLERKMSNNLHITTSVNSIEPIRDKLGLITKIEIKYSNKKVVLDIKNAFKGELFDEKHFKALEIIDGNVVVDISNKKNKPLVEYYAHTDIDEVYGLEGKWGLVDIRGNIIIKPKYIYPFIKCGDNLQVMLPHSYKIIHGKRRIISLKHGLIDTKGNIIIPIKYLFMESMDNRGKYFRVVDPKTYKSGILDNGNNIIVPFIYEYIDGSPDIELCENTGYGSIYPDYIYQVKISNNDLYGIYDLLLKKEIIKPKYKYIKIIDYNKFLVGEDYDNCKVMINENEKIIK